jgi:NAD(P)-dependent dehydrogenase (short-subunit alcohol dehydrogenase family)
MKILVTGSAGHLGEALMRTLKQAGHDPIGLDILASPYIDCMPEKTAQQPGASDRIEGLSRGSVHRRPVSGRISRRSRIGARISAGIAPAASLGHG